MGIYQGGTALKELNLGGGSISKVYLGDSLIRPTGWVPTSNTIAYFPFKDNKDNVVQGGPAISSSNIGIVTLDGVKCVYFDGSSLQTLSCGFTTANITSVMVWIKQYEGHILNHRYKYGNTDQHRVFTSHDSKIDYQRYQNASAHIQNIYYDNTKWSCIGITEDSSGAKVFINGGTSPAASNGTIRSFTALTNNTGIGCITDYSSGGGTRDPATGYMSNLVLMNAPITVTDFLKFYNETKSYYGIQ